MEPIRIFQVHFLFLIRQLKKNVGALHSRSMLTNDSNVYVVMSGNFTPAQRHIVNSQCMIDVSDFKEVYEWLRVNNPNFTNFKEFDDCPSPILVEGENSLEEESENSTLEKQIEIQYFSLITVTKIPLILFLILNKNLLILY